MDYGDSALASGLKKAAAIYNRVTEKTQIRRRIFLDSMRYCSCGNAAIENGAECARCRALRIFGLQNGATDEEIKTAYTVLVKVWHPDRFAHDDVLKAQAEDKLKGINAAYRYLTSKGGREKKRQTPAAAAPTAPFEVDEPGAEEPPFEKRQEATHSKKRGSPSVLRSIVASRFAFNVAFLAVIALVGWLLFLPVDRFLSSSSLTSEPYRQFKSECQRAVWGAEAEVAGYWSEMWHRRTGGGNAAAPAPVEASQETAAPHEQGGKSRAQNAGQNQSGAILPYVTAGLSEKEVISVEGAPTTETETELTYGHTELYFNNDRLVGWKIDAASPHIRVKLWPDAAVDPELDSFWIGSSKNEVLAVEGTPTLWSENTFGYGGSEVYFKDGRVVSWKNDAATFPLHAKPR